MQRVDVRDLAGARFACLPGCGFCCTFPPEVSRREQALLRARLAPRPVPVAVDRDGRAHLALQSGCGACTLLARRECSAYDLRPAHCRYFPFHVHFGPTPEAYVNYTCRGVARAPGASLEAAFEESVLRVASSDEMARHEAEARAAYGAFERLARRKGAWGDARAAVAEALAPRGDALTGAWVGRLLRAAGDDATLDDAVEDALSPFGADDVGARPFHLAEDLRWLTFERDGATLRAKEMDETGTLSDDGRAARVEGWADLPGPVRLRLADYLARLAGRGIFLGSVYALVDDEGYALGAREAALLRVAEVAADLVVRARVLADLGAPPERLADETERFYDSAFLDSPTIGGVL
ncbi:MAG TPA: YkgJ family cysteine cluster protein [Candidatus Thermoplasmatota archaeon]|nr:YkgJ family cysteine cluster protein [Candidatus Thermoplasmatota archaeon]